MHTLFSPSHQGLAQYITLPPHTNVGDPSSTVHHTNHTQTAPALGLDHLGQCRPVLGLGDVLADLGLGQQKLAVGDVQLVVQLRDGEEEAMVVDARMRSGAGYKAVVVVQFLVQL